MCYHEICNDYSREEVISYLEEVIEKDQRNILLQLKEIELSPKNPVNNLPSEQREKAIAARREFVEQGYLRIEEPCNCGNRIQHNNGGNYHQIITLKRDSGSYFIKEDTTCELTAEPEWWPLDNIKEVFKEIEKHADWL